MANCNDCKRQNDCPGLNHCVHKSQDAERCSAEIERLRSALRGLLEFPSGQYSEGDGYDEACDSAQAALTPNAEFSGPPPLAGDPEAAKVRVYAENLEAEIERIRAALLGLLAFDLENDGATCDWPELQVAIKAARGLGLVPNVAKKKP